MGLTVQHTQCQATGTVTWLYNLLPHVSPWGHFLLRPQRKTNVPHTHGPQYNDSSWHWKTKCPANSWTSVQWQLMALENKMSCKLMDLSTMTTHGTGKQNVLQTHGPQYNDNSWHWKTKCPANSWTSVQWQIMASATVWCTSTAVSATACSQIPSEFSFKTFKLPVNDSKAYMVPKLASQE